MVSRCHTVRFRLDERDSLTGKGWRERQVVCKSAWERAGPPGAAHDLRWTLAGCGAVWDRRLLIIRGLRFSTMLSGYFHLFSFP
ncbi:hypothetical protein LshimejAT787_1101130 [Lyophyllum shimeji]|uniref:Uncharacterized protein n=1 Tax=Lyophyllum shimeji TaxID=47721 RepID=A0A9P3UQY4_LYOSH|nr:hypothetical protein LshimejAT787_1101130 [Lyophyllum shimeji]